MTRKTQAAYTHLLHCINNKIIHLQPTTFLTDYEIAMRNAIRGVYPDTKMYFYWPHVRAQKHRSVTIS